MIQEAVTFSAPDESSERKPSFEGFIPWIFWHSRGSDRTRQDDQPDRTCLRVCLSPHAFGILNDIPLLQVVAWSQSSWTERRTKANLSGDMFHILFHMIDLCTISSHVVYCPCWACCTAFEILSLSISHRVFCPTSEALTGALALDHYLESFEVITANGHTGFGSLFFQTSNFFCFSDFLLGVSFLIWAVGLSG